MESINIFFNALKTRAGAIWLEKVRIKFSAPLEFQNQETDKFIIANKSEIISILSDNRIFSKEDFFNRLILKAEIAPCYGLSFAQERLWFIEQYEEGTNAYHMPNVFELDSQTDASGVEYALQQIVSRHEVLRSTIELGQEQRGVQVVHDDPLLIEEVELPSAAGLDDLLKGDINRPFNLQTEYPIRVKFYRIKEEVSRTIVLINTHHIASDGWSTEVFQRELVSYYESYITDNKSFRLPALEIQYKDYAAWQRSYLMGTVLEGQLRYWREKLSDYQTLEFPTDYPRPKLIDYKGSSEYFVLDREVSKRLKNLSRQQGVTLHSVMLSSLSILLSKYTGQEDIVIGSPIANRQYSQTQDLIGFFVNTQVNRILLSKNQRYEDLIQQVHQDQVAAQLHQDLPFEKLVEELKVDRDTSRHPVFQVMFGVQSFGNDKVVASEYKQYFKPYAGSVSLEVGKFDLSIFIDNSGDEFTGRISYATSLFQRDTIVRLINHYSYLLEQLTHTPGKAYSELSLLSPEEYKKIVVEWNHTDREFPKDKTIHEMFQEQVARTPDHIALVYEGEQLSYRELNEKSNQLARYIRAQYKERTRQELLPDTLIALCLDRSLEMVVGILGVLKAGGVCVPIDPEFPQERIAYILEDTGAVLVLTKKEAAQKGKIPQHMAQYIYIELTGPLYAQNDKSNLPANSKSTDLAYLIYTSGTTGKPKGVVTEHRSIVNGIDRLIKTDKINSSFKIGSKIPYTFDPSLREMLLALFTGAELTVISTEVSKNTDDLVRYCGEIGIELLVFVPSHLSAFLTSIRESEGSRILQKLKIIYSCGEKLSASLAKDLRACLPNVQLKNQYGPSEVSQVSVELDLFNEERDQDQPSIPLGRLTANTKCYVLDPNLISVPIGVLGDLYIGGVGVARGYLNNEILTSEHFILNPFATSTEIENGYNRMYKTGDLTRWLPNGELESLGRRDDQVKIRGYRVELNEINAVLSGFEEIKHSCVLVRERETTLESIKYLVGYYSLNAYSTGDNLKRQSKEKISARLSTILPDYMIPSVWVVLDEFPVTANGKLNKQALPDPEFMQSEDYVAPSTDIEQSLAKIWQELLGLERVGITDDFFRIGGNSILVMSVISRIRRSLSFEISLKEFFLNTTIAMIGKLLEGKQVQSPVNQSVNLSSIKDLHNPDGLYPVLPIQEWRYLQYLAGGHYPMNALIRKELLNVDLDMLVKAINALVARHESLRAMFLHDEIKSFKRTRYLVSQKIYDTDALTVPFSFEDIREQSDKKGKILATVSEFQKYLFDFRQELPFKCKLIQYESEKYLFLFLIDHITYDPPSLRIIMNELLEIYYSYCEGRESSLEPLPLQFRHYVNHHLSHYIGEKVIFHHSYFKHLFRDGVPGKMKLKPNILNTQAFDQDAQNATVSPGKSYVFMVSKEILTGIRELTAELKISFFNFILSGYCLLLSQISDQKDLVIDVPVSTRENEEFSKLIGWMLGKLIIRVKVDDEKNFRDLTYCNQKIIAEAMDHLYYDNIESAIGAKWNNVVSAQLNLINDLHSIEPAIDPFEAFYNTRHTSCDLSFTFRIFENGIVINCLFNSRLIDEMSVPMICEKFVDILGNAVKSPKTKLKYL